MINTTTALYVRTDTPDAESIRRQINNLSTYAKTHGYIVTRTFADDGYDGNSTNRSGFDEMMNAAKNHSISTVMATDGYRLARDIILLRRMIRELSENGIRVILLYEKMDILPPQIHDKENGLDYVLNGDYYIPILFDPGTEDHRAIGKWGRMRQEYLKEYRPGLYTQLLLGGTLHKTLADLDEQAKEMHELLIRRMIEIEGITEVLKEKDPMEWVQRMNNVANRAEEIVKAELIFA